jgi:hypothetical protein
MKYNSIEGISRWYENGSSWEEWEVVKSRALKEWREEIESAYKSGIEYGMGNTKMLMDGMEKNVEKLRGDIEIPMSSEDWFENNWE